MKRFLILLLFIPIITRAGVWTKQVVEPDELLGRTKGYISYIYTEGHKQFVFWSDLDDQFKIKSQYEFNCKYSSLGEYCDVLIGLYDDDNNLLERIEMVLLKRDNLCKSIGTRNVDTIIHQPMHQRENAQKIIQHLTGTNGYVRIVTNTYADGGYELIVPPCNILE